MAEVDRCPVRARGVHGLQPRLPHAPSACRADQVDDARAVLRRVLVARLWCQPIPGARDAARRLADAGVRLAVTSNSDGTVADMLARHEIAQVGPGPGVAVEVITDSGVVGVAKPDPAMFAATAEGLGLPPGRVCHIGDSGTYDADGAAAAGMRGRPRRPAGPVPGPGHVHVASLADFADRLLGVG